MENFYTDWEDWKKFLSKAVHTIESIGLSEKRIESIAYHFGKLVNKIEPGNHEQRAIKELWDVGDENDRRVLAKLMTKLVDNYNEEKKRETKKH